VLDDQAFCFVQVVLTFGGLLAQRFQIDLKHGGDALALIER